jgi:GGDEF domain-containing protein
VVIAPGMKSDSRNDRANELNQLAIRAGRKVCGKDLISLSVGTAFCPSDGFDAERLLAEADRKMYAMKQLHHEQLQLKDIDPLSELPTRAEMVN